MSIGSLTWNSDTFDAELELGDLEMDEPQPTCKYCNKPIHVECTKDGFWIHQDGYYHCRSQDLPTPHYAEPKETQ